LVTRKNATGPVKPVIRVLFGPKNFHTLFMSPAVAMLFDREDDAGRRICRVEEKVKKGLQIGNMGIIIISNKN
jgi:hypothetical protein